MEQLLTTLVDMAKTAGPFATVLMLILYVRADNERKALDKEVRELLRSAKETADALIRIIERTGRGNP